MDVLDGIIVGAAAAAIGTIIATKFMYQGGRPIGGDRPYLGYAPGNPTIGAVPVAYPDTLASDLPPVQQNQPITEAAYNQQPVAYEPAFNTNGNENWEVITQ
jgi:hypothetical protein